MCFAPRLRSSSASLLRIHLLIVQCLDSQFAGVAGPSPAGGTGGYRCYENNCPFPDGLHQKEEGSHHYRPRPRPPNPNPNHTHFSQAKPKIHLLLQTQAPRREIYLFCKMRDVTPKRIRSYMNSEIDKYNLEHPGEPYMHTDEDGLGWAAAMERAKDKAPRPPDRKDGLPEDEVMMLVPDDGPGLPKVLPTAMKTQLNQNPDGSQIAEGYTRSEDL